MTIDKFAAFAQIVAASFQAIAQAPQVYVAGGTGEVLYRCYLDAFPAGTDPTTKAKTEHDCACCQHFIRHAGSAIAVDDQGNIRTVWDEAAAQAPYPYASVAATLRDHVRAAGICGIYCVKPTEHSFGAVATRSLTAAGTVLTWSHLHTGAIPKELQVASPDQVRGDYHTTVQVFTRGLNELAPAALDTVFALIEANSVYRAVEHRTAVVQFMAAQQAYRAKLPPAQAIFAWTHARGPAARFRNTVIGTLVQDLSEGIDVEHAVKNFEAKVAPPNYQRTTAIITPAMVRNAMKTIETLGLEPALERRFATIRDISINDVLWVDGSIKPALKDGIEGTLMQIATAAHAAKPAEERAEAIGLEAFVAQVLPKVTSMEVLLQHAHLGNLMSLTAPVHPEPRQLFRWDNDFAWSYAGNLADSTIADRVKKAGGQVEGATFRASLGWRNFDDLDLRIRQPPGRGSSVQDEIFYGAKHGWTGGTLDVDMNAGYGRSREAVENIVWMQPVPDGPYKIVVNNFAQRETSNVGFAVEVECAGKLLHFAYNKMVRDRQDVHVVTLHLHAGRIDRIEPGDPAITTSQPSQTKWGLATEQYIPVDAVTLSPNYWGTNAVGNKHTFFILRGALSEEATRGIYNEFLHPRLAPHRRVFEVIGDRTKCAPTAGQLSGLGFSSTRRTDILVRVQQGKKQRLFQLHVGA